jgi:hypothetical protein
MLNPCTEIQKPFVIAVTFRERPDGHVDRLTSDNHVGSLRRLGQADHNVAQKRVDFGRRTR